MRRTPFALGVFCLALVSLAIVRHVNRHPAHAAAPARPSVQEAETAPASRVLESTPTVSRGQTAPPKSQPIEPPKKADEAEDADFSDEEDAIVVSTQGTPSVAQNRIDAEAVETAGNAVVPALNRCYREALARDASLRGDIMIELTISPQEGAEHALIEDATIDAEEFQAPLFEQCLLSAVLALRLPNPTARQYISYPFTLDPGDDD